MEVSLMQVMDKKQAYKPPDTNVNTTDSHNNGHIYKQDG